MFTNLQLFAYPQSGEINAYERLIISYFTNNIPKTHIITTRSTIRSAESITMQENWFFAMDMTEATCNQCKPVLDEMLAFLSAFTPAPDFSFDASFNSTFNDYITRYFKIIGLNITRTGLNKQTFTDSSGKAVAILKNVFLGGGYMVVAELNGGTYTNGDKGNIDTTDNYNLNLPSQPPTKPGYTFAGWYADSAFTTPVANGEPLIPLGNSNDQVIINAKWTAIPSGYSVDYNSNGGSAVTSLTGVTALPNPLPTPTKQGFAFAGWYTEPATTNLAVAGSAITANVTIYAKWNIITYAITYHLDGGQHDGLNPPNYTVATPTINLFTASKFGYTFGGWFTDSGYLVQATPITLGSTGEREFFALFSRTMAKGGYVDI
ncbi:MAG: InlB B-repeat-containing protein [Clostridia bacterium]